MRTKAHVTPSFLSSSPRGYFYTHDHLCSPQSHIGSLQGRSPGRDLGSTTEQIHKKLSGNPTDQSKTFLSEQSFTGCLKIFCARLSVLIGRASAAGPALAAAPGQSSEWLSPRLQKPRVQTISILSPLSLAGQSASFSLT